MRRAFTEKPNNLGFSRDGCGSKPTGSHFGVGAPLILEPILVVGLGCSLGVRDFDPWPYGVVVFFKVLEEAKPRTLKRIYDSAYAGLPQKWSLVMSTRGLLIFLGEHLGVAKFLGGNGTGRT